MISRVKYFPAVKSGPSSKASRDPVVSQDVIRLIGGCFASRINVNTLLRTDNDMIDVAV